jgi:hypothetical protein
MRKGWLPALSVLLAVAFGFFAGYLVRGPHQTPAPAAVKSVVVPNLVGMTQAEALHRLGGFSLPLPLIPRRPVHSNTVPAGHIIEQSPAPGTLVKAGTGVRILVSTGPSPSPSPTPLKTVSIGSWTGAKPKTIWFSGDSGNIVTNITWSSWGPNSGVGRGTWHYDNCVPDCAQGTVTDYPASIRVSHPSAGQFTRLTEAQSGPHGRTYTFPLPDPGLNGASSGTVFDR